MAELGPPPEIADPPPAPNMPGPVNTVAKRKRRKVFDKDKKLDAEHDRLNVRLAMRHEHCCEDPVGVDINYCLQLKTIEQPYQRRMRLTEEWQPLDTHWVAAVSCIVIESAAHPPRQQNPTPEELAADAAAVVEYGYANTPPFTVQPGSHAFFQPSQMDGLLIRCQKGTREIWLTAMPG